MNKTKRFHVESMIPRTPAAGAHSESALRPSTNKCGPGDEAVVQPFGPCWRLIGHPLSPSDRSCLLSPIAIRYKRASRPDQSPAGHSRSLDSQSARLGRTPRPWRVATSRADHARHLRSRARITLSGAAPSRSSRTTVVAVGSVRKQSTRQVLQTDRVRSKAARSGNRKLEAYCGGDQLRFGGGLTCRSFHR
jgi:hypothetical protein